MPLTLNAEDPASLAAYLRDSGHVDREEPLDICVLRGGVSNRTVLVRRRDGRSWVIKQALPKLRVQVDWFSDPRRNEREATGMRWLVQLAPPDAIPRLVFEDPTQHLLAMEAVPEPHENWKNRLLTGRVERSRIEQFAELLGTIHARSGERATELSLVFTDRQYFESLRLEPYYGYTTRQVPSAADFLEQLIADTRAVNVALVHGDFSPKNILLSGTQMFLVDHEVIHWGDPAFDLGFSLTHLLSKAHFMADDRDLFSAATKIYWNVYAARVRQCAWYGDLEPRAVRHTLGCLLARVAGRSPLEYFDEPCRVRQREVVVQLMRNPPTTVEELTENFLLQLAATR